MADEAQPDNKGIEEGAADNTEAQGTQGDEGGAAEPKPINWEKRYADSSAEAKRLYEENVRLKAEQDAAAKARSLTEQQQQAQQAQFPARSQFVQFWTEKGWTEDAANARYDVELAQHNQVQFLHQSLQALGNRLKFKEAEIDQIATESNPDAAKAVEFWKDNPVMAALPVADQLKQYRSALTKMGVTPERVTRDLTEKKRGASSPVGGGGGSPSAATSEQDDLARSLGYPSAKAQEEYVKTVRTVADHNAFCKKWKVKL